MNTPYFFSSELSFGQRPFLAGRYKIKGCSVNILSSEAKEKSPHEHTQAAFVHREIEMEFRDGKTIKSDMNSKMDKKFDPAIDGVFSLADASLPPLLGEEEDNKEEEEEENEEEEEKEEEEENKEEEENEEEEEEENEE